MSGINWQFIAETYSQQEEDELNDIRSTIIEPQDTSPVFNKGSNLFEELISTDKPNEKLHALTGFSIAEFLELFSVVEECFATRSQGKKAFITPKDSFFLLLVHLKTNRSHNDLAATYNLEKHAVFRSINKALDRSSPVLQDRFVKCYSFQEQQSNGWISGTTDHTAILDVTFQPTTKPIAHWIDQKLFFSGKHWDYGVKTQTINAQNGICMSFVSGLPGARHDYDIFIQSLAAVKDKLLKGSGLSDYTVLADLAYIGGSQSPEIVLKTPKRSDQITCPEDFEWNNFITRHRVIVERFYGRLKLKFKIMRDTYSYSKDNYSKVAGLCIALTNYHVLKYPLRIEEGEFYTKLTHKQTGSSYSNFLLKKKKKTSKRRRLDPVETQRNGCLITIQDVPEEADLDDFE
jgi:hypothetical protein